MAQSSMLPFRLVAIGIPLLAAMAGLVAGVSPVMGIALGGGMAYVLLVLSDLALGLALFVVISFLENLTFGGGFSLAKAGGAVLFFSWLALVATDSGQQRRRLMSDHPLAVFTMLALATWVLLSSLWAISPSTVFGSFGRWALNLCLFPVVYTALRDRQDLQRLFALFVAGCLLSAAIGLALGGAGAPGVEGDTRLGGTGLNANYLGQLLIVSTVLSGFLAVAKDLSADLRVVATGAAGLSLIFLLLTVSREAILGLGVSLLVAPLLIGPGRRVIAVVMVVAVAAGGAFYFFGFAPAAARQRVTDGDTTGSGRTDIWRVGVRMAKANPVLGVGADNYALAAPHYLVEPGLILRSDHILDQQLPAHNVYLQAQAELGAPGLLMLLGLFGFSLTSAMRGARRFAELGERTSELLARGLAIALVGYLVSEFFSTAIYSKQLWILLGVAVALPNIAENVARERRRLA